MTIFLIVILGLFVYDAYRRIALIENRLKNAEGSMNDINSTSSLLESVEEDRPILPEYAYTPEETKQTMVSHEKEEKNRPNDKVADYWLAVSGVILLVLSLGWFVTYAFTHDWVGPTGRIIIGVVFGLAVVAGGVWLHDRSPVRSRLIVLVGVAALHLSILAGMVMYDLYSTVIGLVYMAIVTMLITALSVWKRSSIFTALALISGLVAPLFVLKVVQIDALAAYLLAVSVGIVSADLLLRKKVTTIFAFAGVFIYSVLLYGLGRIDRGVVSELGMVLFSILFLVANIGSIIRLNADSENDLALVGFIGFAVAMWTRMVFDSSAFGVAHLVSAMVFGVIAYGLFLFARSHASVFMYGIIATMFLFLATGEMLDGNVLTIVATIEIGALSVASYVWLRQKGLLFGRLFSGFLLWPMALSLRNVSELFSKYADSDVNATEIGFAQTGEHLVVLGTIAVVLGLIAFAARYRSLRITNEDAALWQLPAFVGVVYTMLCLWFFVRACVVGHSEASMIALIVFAVIGVLLYLLARMRNMPFARTVSISFFVVVLARLFVVEFWNMTAVEKIITFFVVGVLLLSTAFLSKKRE